MSYYSAKQANKYHAKRAALFPGGKLYASTAERDYAGQLRLLEQAGDIAELVEQPTVTFYAGFNYRPDFAFLDCAVGAKAQGTRVYCDVKGVTTDRFRLVKAAWRLFGPGYLQIVQRAGRRQAFRVVEEIPPGECVVVKRSEVAA